LLLFLAIARRASLLVILGLVKRPSFAHCAGVVGGS
jgi:hypothetical protein